MSKRVNVSVPDGLFDEMEAARGDVSRSKFVQRALEKALADGGRGDPGTAPVNGEHETEPASPRTSAKSAGELPKIAPRHWAQS